VFAGTIGGDAIRRYIPELDGLRAFAIAAVLVVHSNFGFPIGWLERARVYGWAGVDLFFVISGYLITSILLDSRDKPHYYRNFYARRGLRIWPLYYLLLLFVFVVSPHLGNWANQDYNPRVHRWPYYLFYVQNLVYSRLGSFSLVITWSLCVEEQFYLVWPFLVRLCSRRALTAVAIAVLVAETPFRMFLHHLGTDMGFFFTFARLDPIAVGALVALNPRWFKYTWLAAPWAFWLIKRGDFEYIYLALSLAFGWVVMRAVVDGSRFLCLRPLRFLGRISYGVYILHPIAFAIFWLTPYCWIVEKWPGGTLLRMIGQVLIPLPLAALSWYAFEKPILGLKKYFEVPSPAPATAETAPLRALAAQSAD
jgi:peptidoglycan/LPS O-acetylase OafA/YrhL